MKKNNFNKTYKVAVKKIDSKAFTFNRAFISRESYNNLCREYKDLSNKFAQLGLNPDEEVTCYRRYRRVDYNSYESEYQKVCSYCSTFLTDDMRYCPYCGRKIVKSLKKNISSLCNHPFTIINK